MNARGSNSRGLTMDQLFYFSYGLTAKHSNRTQGQRVTSKRHGGSRARNTPSWRNSLYWHSWHFHQLMPRSPKKNKTTPSHWLNCVWMCPGRRAPQNRMLLLLISGQTPEQFTNTEEHIKCEGQRSICDKWTFSMWKSLAICLLDMIKGEEALQSPAPPL